MWNSFKNKLDVLLKVECLTTIDKILGYRCKAPSVKNAKQNCKNT